MYIDYEGHRIATSLADAAAELTMHEQANYFGFDCYASCCADMHDNAYEPEAEPAEDNSDDSELIEAMLASDEWEIFVPGGSGDEVAYAFRDGDEPPF